MSPGLMTSQALLANCVGLAAGALAVKVMMDQESSHGSPSSPCPTCNGAKRVPCMCSRYGLFSWASPVTVLVAERATQIFAEYGR